MLLASKLGQWLAGVGGGVGFVLIVSSLLLGSSGLLLGVGFFLLMLSLVFLQLSFWREGDRTARRHEGTEARLKTVSVPTALQRNPRLVNVWNGMEATRQLMERKKESTAQDERQREKARLQLSDAESILLIGEPSLMSLWPLAFGSGLCLSASAAFTGKTFTSFVCLIAGLSGLLLLSLMRGRLTYYLTSHRVLVRKRVLWKRAEHWSALRYDDIKRWSCAAGSSRGRISLTAHREHLDVVGLPRSLMTEAVDILRENLSAETMCKNPDTPVNELYPNP